MERHRGAAWEPSLGRQSESQFLGPHLDQFRRLPERAGEQCQLNVLGNAAQRAGANETFDVYYQSVAQMLIKSIKLSHI